MKILIEVIKKKLFENQNIRNRILRDYSVASTPKTPEELAELVTGRIGQISKTKKLDQPRSNNVVFQAAVKALASNSRSWANFLRFEPVLRDLLGNYSASYTDAAFNAGRLNNESIKRCLPGQSSRNDTNAIIKWASILNRQDSYYDVILRLSSDLMDYSLVIFKKPISESRLPLVIVGVLAGPSKSSTPSFIKKHKEQLLWQGNKLPGMSYILASEFMRNLHWNAFKPDRHIKRLFDIWCPDILKKYDSEVRDLMHLIGDERNDLETYLKYSIAGIELSPENLSISYVDNLVWLLGAYVEKKGRESTTEYIDGCIKTYEPNHRQNVFLQTEKDKEISMKKPPTKIIPVIDVLEMSWKDYYQAIYDRDKINSIDRRLNVISEINKWFKEYKHFSKFPLEHRSATAGFSSKTINGIMPNWRLFGGMGGAGKFTQKVNGECENISLALDAIPLEGVVTKEHFLNFRKELSKALDFKNPLAVATRLLCVKRPDYFVCINAGNLEGRIYESFNTKRNLHIDDYWDVIVEKIINTPWWKSDSPQITKENLIHNARAAFLDAIFYREKAPEIN